MASEEEQPWKQACHFVLCGCVVGFCAALLMLAMPGRREPVAGLRGHRLGPCNPVEDPSAPLPFCKKRVVAPSRKSQKSHDALALNESAVQDELRKRQDEVEKAKQDLAARNEADVAAAKQRAKQKAKELLEAERQHKELLEKQKHLLDKRENSSGKPKELLEKQKHLLDKRENSSGKPQDAPPVAAPREEEEEDRSLREPEARDASASSQLGEEEEEEKEEDGAHVGGSVSLRQGRPEDAPPAAAPREEEEDRSLREPEAPDASASSQLGEEEEDKEVPCHTAVRGEECFHHVVWTMHEGFHEHPDWYPGLTAKSSFAEFQYVMNLTGSASQRCPMPCLAKKEHSETAGCRTASPGEECYKRVLWAKSHGIYEHPEWYGDLSNTSSFEAFQDYLRTDRRAHCPKPCSPNLQLLLH